MGPPVPMTPARNTPTLNSCNGLRTPTQVGLKQLWDRVFIKEHVQPPQPQTANDKPSAAP